jgi:hypothetical protein
MTLKVTYLQATHLLKRLLQNPSTYSGGFHDVPGIAFLRHEIAEYALTGGYVTLSQWSRTLKKSNF